MFETKLKGIINIINGNKGMMTTQILVRDVLDIYSIDKSVNRDINYNRLKPLSTYINSYDSEVGIFLPSLIFSFDEDPSYLYNMVTKELTIPLGSKLKVLDGQHRIKGLEDLLERSEDRGRKDDILNSSITAQIYFNLKEYDEKNLFADINSNAKRVSMSLVTKYDTRDITRVLVRDLYNVSKPLQVVGVEFNKSRIVRPTSTSFFTSARLKIFIMNFLFGRVQKVSKKIEKLLKENYDEVLVFLEKFFTILFNILPSDPGDVRKYVLGHEALQTALALYLHEAIILESENDLNWFSDWETEIERLKLIDWNVSSSLWQPYLMKNRVNTNYEFDGFIENNPNGSLSVLHRELLEN
ncbi:DNA sulfur modification protein DndB [Bacillus sp. TH25]|uniref:DNA sulfur modification protein DndB n=1 Tax=Bacillus sp. TH25 TaxID=2796391 RepID=UPI0019119B55|nr:DNA sulfur modification protein DndB [Bacillus sp. TH25]MBK5432453.1 DGQHR domain-containing protein [Bacillus sp. TH25]